MPRRIDQQWEYHGVERWSTKYVSEYWRFGNHPALLDDNRWVKGILQWNPGSGRPGRSLSQWQTPIQKFCRWHHLSNSLDIAETPICVCVVPILHRLHFLCPTMMLFSRFHLYFVHTMLLRFTSCARNGPPLGIQDQTQKKITHDETIWPSIFAWHVDITLF